METFEHSESYPGKPIPVNGDWSSLRQQLGAAEELAPLSLSIPLDSRKITSFGALREYLKDYFKDVLLPMELHSICKAFHHAQRSEARELIELDKELQKSGYLKELSQASQNAGRRQLRRMRPLKDQKLIKKYWDAVDGGEAVAWHTLVYGVFIAVYSLPLRQALAHYAQQTVAGFLLSAGRSIAIREEETQALLNEFNSILPQALDLVLGDSVTIS